MDELNIDDLIVKGEGNVKGESGSLLIAAPSLVEPYFLRSVVLLLEEEPGMGVLGLTLNKATTLSMADIMPEMKGAEKFPLFVGGPVDHERLFLMHTMPERFSKSIRILPGLYLGGEQEEVEALIKDGVDFEGKIRFYLGYSGWEGDQLTKELLENHWIVNPNPVVEDLLKGEEEEYWRREVKRFGESYRGWLVVPVNPSLN